MKIIALSSAYSWIFSIILLNHGTIRVSSFPLSIEGLWDFGFDLLLDHVLNNEKEESEDVTMTEIASRIDDIEDSVKDSATNVINEVGHIFNYEKAMRSFTRDVSYILTLYDWFKKFSKGFETKTSMDFAKVCLTEADTGLTSRLNRLMNLISPNKEIEATPLFDSIIEHYSDQERTVARCDKPLSVQQEIYRMYGEVTLYLIKGYSMIFNAYEIKRKLTDKQFKTERKYTKKSYKRAMRELTRSALAAMLGAPRDIRGCDAKISEKNGSYIELRWLFKKFHIPVYHLSKYRSCVNKCEAYSNVRALRRPKGTNWPLCDGLLYNCSHSRMVYACAGTKEGRFYDSIGTKEEDLTQCKALELEDHTERFHVSSAQGDSHNCDMCSCTCDSKFDEKTTRSFSLRQVQSRTSENMVITGLRFVEVNQCIYIQIQEGKLMANGYIDQSTVKWQPVKESSRERIRIDWELKTVYLGTMDLPVHSVMTGVSFDSRKGYVQLRIRGHFFDYSLGTLRKGNLEYWYPATDEREQIEIEEPDIPTKAKSGNVVTSGDNLSVDFRITDEGKDAGQTTIPFLDAQVVETRPPRPLAGAGLYYRGQKGYGGFIALKLVAYDYAKVLAKKSASIPDI